jgi:hypothetical protein
MPSSAEEKPGPIIKKESIKNQAEKTSEIEDINRTIDGIENELEDIAEEIRQGYRLINKSKPDEEGNRVILTQKMRNEMVEDSDELRRELEIWKAKLKEPQIITDVEDEELRETNNRRGKELEGYDIPTKTAGAPPKLPPANEGPEWQQADGTLSDRAPEATSQRQFQEIFPAKNPEIMEKLPDGTWGSRPKKETATQESLDKDNAERAMDELLDQDQEIRDEEAAVEKLSNDLKEMAKAEEKEDKVEDAPTWQPVLPQHTDKSESTKPVPTESQPAPVAPPKKSWLPASVKKWGLRALTLLGLVGGAKAVEPSVSQIAQDVSTTLTDAQAGYRDWAENTPMVQEARRQEKINADMATLQAQSAKEKAEALVAGKPVKIGSKTVQVNESSPQTGREDYLRTHMQKMVRETAGIKLPTGYGETDRANDEAIVKHYLEHGTSSNITLPKVLESSGRLIEFRREKNLTSRGKTTRDQRVVNETIERIFKDTGL